MTHAKNLPETFITSLFLSFFRTTIFTTKNKTQQHDNLFYLHFSFVFASDGRDYNFHTANEQKN
jgi:hypothetical protein